MSQEPHTATGRTPATLEAPEPSDVELIAAARGGATEPFQTLYQRHSRAAHNLARQLTRCASESAEDLVAEAFTRVLRAIRNGGGPDSGFRTYLLASLRNVAYERYRRNEKVHYVDDLNHIEGSARPAEEIMTGLEHSLVARAFSLLPERWQTVLWHTEVESQNPAKIAPILGLSANSVAALAYRAREGLRQAYLQVHLAETKAVSCQGTIGKLGAWVREGLGRRERAQVEAHLDHCDQCRALCTELAELNSSMRAFIAPAILGIGALGYLAAVSSSAASGAVVAGAAAGSAVLLSTQGTTGVAAIGGSAAAGTPWFAALSASGALAAAVTIGTVNTPDEPVEPVAAPSSTAPATITAKPRPEAVRTPIQPPVDEAPDPQGGMPVDDPEPEPEPEPVAGTTPPRTPNASKPVRPPDAEEPGSPEDQKPVEPDPEPAVATLAATLPVTFTLKRGESAPLPVTLTASNAPIAGPASVSLQLPPGIAVESDSAAVSCTPAGSATVCRTDLALKPDIPDTIALRVRAEAGAVGGTMTGAVTAGGLHSPLPAVSVGVVLADRVAVSATRQPALFGTAEVDVTVTNTGDRAGTAKLTVPAPPPAFFLSASPGCVKLPWSVSCSVDLAPGEHRTFRLVLTNGPLDKPELEPTVTLGEASATTTVRLTD